MSTNRCFETLDSTVVSGSDRTNSRRQETIYLEMQRNSKKTGPNPLKKNGYRYNQNFISKRFVAQPPTPQQQPPPQNQYRLASAKSYDLLLDVTKGKRFANPVRNVGSNRYKMWGGNVLQVNYEKNPPIKLVAWKINTKHYTSNAVLTVNAVTTISNEIVDPSSAIFSAPCYFSTPGHTPPWIQNVATKDPVFKNTYYYLQGANADPLRGMSFPEEIYFERQEPCLQNDTATVPKC